MFCKFYSYELQLEVECRKKGLGRFMLQILELMSFTANLKKVVLTVFVHNLNAVGFFKSLGYVVINHHSIFEFKIFSFFVNLSDFTIRYSVDETSPESTLEEQFDYEILSKCKKVKT